MSVGRMRVIHSWTDEKLACELRSPIRASLGVEDYILLIAEALARLLDRAPKKRTTGGRRAITRLA